ncbi:unnamed protein product [Urochloa humidicola]
MAAPADTGMRGSPVRRVLAAPAYSGESRRPRPTPAGMAAPSGLQRVPTVGERGGPGSTAAEFGDSYVEGGCYGTELENSVPCGQARRALGVLFEAEASGIKAGEATQLTQEALLVECWSQQIQSLETLMTKEEMNLFGWKTKNIVH